MNINCGNYNKANPQILANLNRKKYYLYVIEQNKKLNANLPKKYSPTYFQTSYDRIYLPNISQVPN
jgi:hypothetical protein